MSLTPVALASALAALVTWPQAWHLGSAVFGHHDTYFSIWRLAWVAHVIGHRPLQLFAANIFYPSSSALTYSDAMLVQGLIASPLLWAGASPVLVYNLVLLLGFVSAGCAMFVLARHVTGRVGPALVAMAALTMAPYRLEHIMHLELQWIAWVPLCWWALHKALENRSVPHAYLAGLFIALQVMSCIYYGVFLVLLLCVFTPFLFVGRIGVRHRAGSLVIAGVVAVAIVLPYAIPYLETGRDLGPRDMRDVVQYSAHPINYLASSSLNRWWGWTSERFGGSETRLFPGATVTVLAMIGLLHVRRRWVACYAAVAIAAFVCSLGVNAAPYRFLFDHLSILHGLRSTARFGIFVCCALGVLASFGADLLSRQLPTRGLRALACAVLVGVVAFEGLARMPPLTDANVASESTVYRMLNALEPGVVLELPVPQLSRLPGWDAYYELWSIHHWRPLVNGYSGYYPPDYVRTLVAMERFPDDASIAALRAHNVRYVIVHESFLSSDGYAQVLRAAERPEFGFLGRFRDPLGTAILLSLSR
jgi:hypothetical protein